MAYVPFQALNALTDAEEVPDASTAHESADAKVGNISSWATSFWDWETPEFGSLC
ncbi:hypothetical protein FB45DRAFT_1034962 [Roridomyces roridus]|uniref:Uncharacterized protein n=1 Tax=Roridomyces roridus TaxID=1738132 RepID=A0AAD7FG55_9AGAR|nr:hypothetical protein FB45DRAFT_1034962 [Roridomyces roridus]